MTFHRHRKNVSQRSLLHKFKRSLCAAKFGDHCFAAAEGDGVYAIQDERVKHRGDGGEREENYACEPDMLVCARYQEGEAAEAENCGLDSEAG